MDVPTTFDLETVGGDANEVFVTGIGAILRLVDGEWNAIAPPAENLFMDIVNFDDGSFALSDRGILYTWDGTLWSVSESSEALFGTQILGGRPDGLWFRELSGRRYGYWDGSTRTLLPRVDRGSQPRTVQIPNARELWVVNVGVYRYAVE